ncbi:MAG TPA: hypothetical protein VMI75_03495 [Polyangiaceae bacterium]|nr:hypothetical protein [Polyangiaceae bacterium]
MSAGPYNWRGARVLTLDGPSFAPWTPAPVVDPAGFREDTVDRRLRRHGTA